MIVEKLDVLGIAPVPPTSGDRAIVKVGIIGSGILGQEIIKAVARYGMEVIFLDLDEEIIAGSMDHLSQDLDLMIEKWALTHAEKATIMSKVRGTLDYHDLADSDMVIEAIKSRSRESMVPVRKEIFKKIESIVSDDCIIATNSTTLVITELSSELHHPERCVSLHFISPVNESKVVEVVCGLHTTKKTFQRICRFAKMIRKKVVHVTESPGIISTRLVAPLINEACGMLLEGVGSVEDIDTTLKLGFGFPLGPFEMADKYGIDRVVRWLENLYAEFGDLRYKASPVLKKMLRANHLGMVTLRGFYSYHKNLTKKTVSIDKSRCS